MFHTLVDGVLHFNTTRVVKLNPTDPLDVTNAEMTAREQMLEMYTFLHDNVPGFEHSQLLYSASEIGVRESRMIVGEYVLTEYDLKDCVRFDDAIAAGQLRHRHSQPRRQRHQPLLFPGGQVVHHPVPQSAAQGRRPTCLSRDAAYRPRTRRRPPYA